MGHPADLWKPGQHALSPETTAALQNALASGWVVGNHYHYGGGGGPDAVAFATYGAYQLRVTERAGR